jgi:hypothetical protein
MITEQYVASVTHSFTVLFSLYFTVFKDALFRPITSEFLLSLK